MVVASSYAWVLHLAEVGKAKKKVCVKLKGGEDAGIEISVSFHERDARARTTYPEVELSVAHYSGVGVREREVTYIGPVMFRQCVWVWCLAFSRIEILNDLKINTFIMYKV